MKAESERVARRSDWRTALWHRIRPRIDTRDVVIVVLLTLNFLFTAHYVNSTVAAGQKAAIASQKAAAADTAQVALCQALNASDAKQLDLWTFILRLPRAPQTAQQRLVLAEFERHLHGVFAPRNCALPRPGG